MSVVASVREQVALVKEIAKATLAKISELSRPKVAERVFELLREGKVNSVSQLQEHMSKCAAMTEVMEEMRNPALPRLRSSYESKRVVRNFTVEKKTANELRLQLIQKDSQIEQLRQEFEGLGQQKKANALADNDYSNGAAQESLANRAYPDMPAEATSLQKAEILCRQLANWEGSYCLTEALETSKCEEAYEKVKEAALRLERSLKTAEECGLLDEKRSEVRHGHHNFDRRGGLVVDKGPGSGSNSDSERASKPTLGDRPESAPTVRKENECEVHQGAISAVLWGIWQMIVVIDLLCNEAPNNAECTAMAYASLVESGERNGISGHYPGTNNIRRTKKEVVSAFVGRSPDEVVILGTNALELLNLRLLKNPEAKSAQMTSRANATVAK
ncbi:hypothetical protein OSTOST_23267, partial [Ostertagia ostertagi]